MEYSKSHIKVKQGSEFSFGLTFSLVFAIIAFYTFYFHNNNPLLLILASITLLLISIIYPKLLYVPNKIWLKFGMILGLIVSPIIMFIIYFFVITPIGLIMKILGKDLLNQKINIQKKSYWTLKNNSSSSIKDQF